MLGENRVTVWLIDWKYPQANDFAVAEEVTVKGVDAKASSNPRRIWLASIGPHYAHPMHLREGCRSAVHKWLEAFVHEMIGTPAFRELIDQK